MASKKFNTRLDMSKEDRETLNAKVGFVNSLRILTQMIADNTSLIPEKKEDESTGKYMHRLINAFTELSEAELKSYLDKKLQDLGFDDKDVVAFNALDGNADHLPYKGPIHEAKTFEEWQKEKTA